MTVLWRGTIMFVRDLEDSKKWSSQNTKIPPPTIIKNIPGRFKHIFDLIGFTYVSCIWGSPRFSKFPALPFLSKTRSETPIVLYPSEHYCLIFEILYFPKKWISKFWDVQQQYFWKSIKGLFLICLKCFGNRYWVQDPYLVEILEVLKMIQKIFEYVRKP